MNRIRITDHFDGPFKIYDNIVFFQPEVSIIGSRVPGALTLVMGGELIIFNFSYY